MIEPIQQKTWSKPERRAWGLGLTLLLFAFAFASVAFVAGRSWTYRTEIEYIPKELSIKAYEIGSDLMDFSLTLPDYAIGEYFVLTHVLPESWIYSLAIVLIVLAVSLVAAGVSYLQNTWLYGTLAAFAVAVTAFSVEAFKPFGMQDKWVSALILLLILAPVYCIQAWLSRWNLARRWLVLLGHYSLLAYLFVWQNGTDTDLSFAMAHLWFPLLVGSLIFIVVNSTDVLQGVLTLLTKEENSKQSYIHFSIFSFLYLANFILIYLRNTGQLTLDIYYLNPFVLQALTTLLGLWMLEAKVEIISDENGKNVGFSSIYIGLATVCLTTIALAFGLANDLMVEVLEDAITLIHFCMGVSFFMYVAINYFQLMGLGLRVHQVMFRPRYMPLAAIPVFGIGGVFVFLLNGGYFPYYQTLSAKQLLLADHAQYSKDLFLAENYLKNALSFDYRNQRSNLSMAGLYYQMGNYAKAQESALASLDKSPSPEAYLAASQIYRQKNLNLYELLQLQEGLSKFPNNGQIMNNLGMSFNQTKYKDSAQYYLAKASESSDAALVGKANLSFFYLLNKLEKEGLPKKSPEQDNSGDWALMNNSLVFANLAGEKSPMIQDIPASFSKIPESIQPYLLFHSYLNKAITKDSSKLSVFQKLESDTLKQYYGEALNLGRGMCLYRTGQTRTGLETLVRLYESSTSNRLDMALLLGQIFYEQGSFGTASIYFKKAAQMGLNQAHYWYALSCLDAGNGAEASDAFVESLSYISQADRVRITVLIDGLKSGKFFNAAQRSDPEKSAYIKISWNKINERELVDLIYLTADKEAKRYLWQYAFRRAYSENWAARCTSLYQFGNQFFKKDEKWQAQLLEAEPLLLEISQNKNGLAKWVEEYAGEKSASFLLGRKAQLENKPKEARSYYLKAIEENPLNNRQMGIVLAFLSQQPDSRQLAYQHALDLSNLDPMNVELLKLYALLSVKEGLPEFAYQVLPKIRNLSSATAGDAFKIQLDEEVNKKGFPVIVP